METIKVLWEEMTPSELDQAVERMPLAIVPCGSVEWHGEHLATGCDNLRAKWICTEAAKILRGGVVLPPLWITAPGFMNYRGSVFFTPALVKQVASELYRELEKCGFCHVLVYLGHGGKMQEECFTEPANEYMKSSTLKIGVSSGVYAEETLSLGNGHAQGGETAEFMACRPDLVHLDRFDPSDTKITKYAGCDPELYCAGLNREQHPAVRRFMAAEDFTWQHDLLDRVTAESAAEFYVASCNSLAEEARSFLAT